MAGLKRQIRALLASLLYFSGLLWLLAAWRLRGRAAVLMYHRVLPAGSDTFSHDGIIVTPATFDRHMRFLRRHFRVLTLDQFGRELTGPGFGKLSCLVTFDDGWHDNFRHALPVLKRHRIPAVVFVATAYVGTERTFWQERLTRLLFHESRTPATTDDVLTELGAVDMRAMTARQAAIRARSLVSDFKSGDPAAIDRLTTRLESQIHARAGSVPGLGEDRFLSWDEAAALHRSGLVGIGSHAHTHTPLPKLGAAGARAELAQSREALVRHGLPAPRICAYPNGNVDDAVEQAARDSGFTLGFATGRGRVSSGDNPMRLRRINVHDRSSATDAEFLCLILGVL